MLLRRVSVPVWPAQVCVQSSLVDLSGMPQANQLSRNICIFVGGKKQSGGLTYSLLLSVGNFLRKLVIFKTKLKQNSFYWIGSLWMLLTVNGRPHCAVHWRANTLVGLARSHTEDSAVIFGLSFGVVPVIAATCFEMSTLASVLTTPS